MSAVKLKICGVKNLVEAELLQESGVDYIGLNFVPSSARCISLQTAQTIVDSLAGSMQTVALFQDQPLDLVQKYAQQLGVDYVQLHGDESAEYAKAVKFPVIRAVPINPATDAATIVNFLSDYPAVYFVLDREQQGQGDPVDAELANKLIAAVPGKICLAGGLSPEILALILEKTHPVAIDISSGVRTGDSIDIAKVQDCLDIIRSARSNQTQNG